MRTTPRRRERQRSRATYDRFVRWSMTERGRFAWHAVHTMLVAAPVLLSL
ncbi:hypothetical protein [Streptomyces sp. 039-1]